MSIMAHRYPVTNGGLLVDPLSDPNLTLKAIAERIIRREQEIEDLMRRLVSLRSRERELQDAILEFEAVYGLSSVNETGAREASSTVSLLDEAETILRESGRTMFSREILTELQNRGFHVSGNDPASNLSAKLSHAKERFVSQGRGKGWGLPEPVASEREIPRESSQVSDPPSQRLRIRMPPPQ